MSEGYFATQKRHLVVCAINYQLIVGQLYKLGLDSILRCCVLNHERPNILGNVTMELWEDMLVARLLPQRYYKQGYGGLRCLKMLRNILGVAMYVREWGIHFVVMSYLYTSSEHYKPLKNGLSISLV
jgi:hypothetical protein